MIGSRWRKVLADLWGNRTRTALVVLSIAVGVFAVGMVVGSQVILSRDMTDSYVATQPASAILYTESFKDDLVQTVRHMPGVREAEGRRRVIVRLNVGPNQWRNLILFAIPDYEDIRLDQVRPEKGAWPPLERELLIERTAAADVAMDSGSVLIETSDGEQRELRLAGTVYDGSYIGPRFSEGWLYGYITFDTMEWLGQPADFNELHIVVADQPTNKAHIQRIVDQVSKKIEQSGRVVFRKDIPTPGEHPGYFMVQPMIVVLGVLGLLSLFLSAFLVINTISALLVQQTRQIGVMKAVGARTGQLVGMYLALALGFGLLATIIAVPLAALATRLLTNYVAGLMNFDLRAFSVPPQMIVIQLVIGLLTPLLAALPPILSGARCTVREAMSNYGLGKGHFGQSWVDRCLESVSGLSRPLLLSLRNTFRRKGRLALTLATLALGGAIFISVVSVQGALDGTLDDLMYYFQGDIYVYFNRPYRIEQVEQAALAVPGVAWLEGWGYVDTRRVRPDDSESNTIGLNAVPADSKLYRPIMVTGRWLLPSDENAIVVGSDILRQEPDVHVGDEIVLDVKGQNTSWRVVGVMLVIGRAPELVAYANYPHVVQVMHEVGLVSRVRIVTTQHDAASQANVAAAVEAHFKRAGLRVSAAETNTELRTRIKSQFDIIVYFLLIMAVMITIVGGLGLMGTMSINVMERTREFGVMRAVGASDGAVQQIVIAEGILIGVIGWLLGSILALPVSKFLCDNVGQAFLDMPLKHTFSVQGVLIWLLIIIILAIVATFVPARNASQLTVRQVLAYE